MTTTQDYKTAIKVLKQVIAEEELKATKYRYDLNSMKDAMRILEEKLLTKLMKQVK